MDPEEFMNRPESREEVPLGHLIREGRAVAHTINFALARHIRMYHDEPGERAEERLREMIAEHERTHHCSLPALQAEGLPYASSTKDRFVAVLTKAVARAVELGIRIHRESLQFHRLEEGLSDDFAERILERLATGGHLPIVLPALGSPEWVDLYRN